ncbi:MAG: YceI family protein [Methylotenera sp.]|nr:YceI family protein [Oligoflexia bacterium]
MVRSLMNVLSKSLYLSGLLIVNAVYAISSTPVDLMSMPGSTVKLDGDSTVRKYTANAASVTIVGKGALNAVSKSASAAKLPWTPLEIEMTLPITSLTSGERTLDKHMRENLKSEKNPNIQLKLNHFYFSGADSATVHPLKATGVMTVAGVSKPLELEAMTAVEGQKVNFKGKKKILMSDFGIAPPVLMMGSLKTKDEIEITYDVTLSPKP